MIMSRLGGNTLLRPWSYIIDIALNLRRSQSKVDYDVAKGGLLRYRTPVETKGPNEEPSCGTTMRDGRLAEITWRFYLGNPRGGGE